MNNKETILAISESQIDASLRKSMRDKDWFTGSIRGFNKAIELCQAEFADEPEILERLPKTKAKRNNQLKAREAKLEAQLAKIRADMAKEKENSKDYADLEAVLPKA